MINGGTLRLWSEMMLCPGFWFELMAIDADGGTSSLEALGSWS